MQRLEVSGAIRPIYGSLGVKWLNTTNSRSIMGQYSINIDGELRKKLEETEKYCQILMLNLVLPYTHLIRMSIIKKQTYRKLHMLKFCAHVPSRIGASKP